MSSRTKHVNGDGVGARLEALKTDLDAIQQDMRGLMADMKGVAANGVTDAMETAANFASEATDKVEAWTADGVGSVRAAVRKQPLAACAISMSAGALIGTWLLRR